MDAQGEEASVTFPEWAVVDTIVEAFNTAALDEDSEGAHLRELFSRVRSRTVELQEQVGVT